MPDVFVSDKKPKKSTQPGVKSDLNRKENKLTYSQQLVKDKPTPDYHPLSSFRYFPAKAEFVNKDPEEKVILLLRKHPITNYRWIAIASLMLIAPSFLTVFPFFEALPSGFQIISIIVWYLLTLAYAFEKFLSWFFQVNIVTDERIFDIDFVNLIYREMTDANIDQIQDVTVELGSALRTVFNFGNVVIQTAAQIPQITFEAVPAPDKVARILRELRVEEEVEKIEGRIR